MQINNFKTSNKKRINILFTSLNPIAAFIKTDLKLLQRNYHVKPLHFKGIKDILKIIKNILWADVTFSWFAGPNAYWAVLLSKIFWKKSIVIVGGFEVAKVPEIGYGGMLDRLSAHRVKFVLKKADRIIAVSEFNKSEILKYTNSKNVELVYNGVDCDKFSPQSNGKNEKEINNIVITVAGIINEYTCIRKGVKTFVKSARYLPHTRFVVVGSWPDNFIEYLKSIAPQNVEFTGYISDDELINWYQKARVYCQLSFYESFGIALAESMCCECIPVVTRNAALPEVVGDTGFYVPYGDEKATAEAIKEALNSSAGGKKARVRIENMFSLEKREKRLINEIESVLKGRV